MLFQEGIARSRARLEQERRQAGQKGYHQPQPLPFDAWEIAVDRFCDTMPGRGYRVSVTAQREPSAAGKVWIFALDGVELGRYILGRDLDGVGVMEVNTGIAEASAQHGARNIPDEARERSRLWAYIMQDLDRWIARAARRIPASTDRDAEILRMWGEGYTERDVGEAVGLSPGTVGNIITRLRKERGLKEVPYHRNP